VDAIPVDEIRPWESAFLRNLRASHGDLLQTISEEKRISDETEAALQEAIEAFNRGWESE
jgi:F-type H+-transporting ATPase subunit alpha